MALQILGGSARGRSLEVPRTARPTGVRVRKSLFDLLEQRYQEGSSFVDLYAGSGAVGFEAASRGYTAILVERDAGALRALERNLRALRLPARVVSGDALGFLRRTPGPFDMVFVDPPFTQDIPPIVGALLTLSGVAHGGVLIAQHPVQLQLPEAGGYALERRVYGSNALSLYWRSGEQPGQPEDTPTPHPKM